MAPIIIFLFDYCLPILKKYLPFIKKYFIKFFFFFIILLTFGYSYFQVYEYGKQSKEKKIMELTQQINELNEKIKQKELDLNNFIKETEQLKSDLYNKQNNIVSELNNKISILTLLNKTLKRNKNDVQSIVSEQVNNQCVIPNGYAKLFNSSIETNSNDTGANSNASSDSGDAPGTKRITLSDVTIACTNNNTEAVQRGQQLKLWKEWYEKNKTLLNNFNNVQTP